jgi:hypothetical protein
MRNRLFSGILFTLLGLLEAVGPLTFFPVCEAMDGKYMKCHWTALAELGIGVIIATLGVLLIVLASRQIRIGISIAIGLNAILVILVASTLIGVCAGIHMRCHALTLPALGLLGILTLLLAAANIWYLWNADRKEGSV